MSAPARALLFLACAIIAALSSCGVREGQDQATAPLVVYSAGPRPLAEALAASFTDETGIPVQLFSATTGQIMAKLEAERYNRRADVVLLASALAAEHLKREDRLLPYTPPNAKDLDASWIDPDGYYSSPSAAAVGIAIRSDIDHANIEWLALVDGSLGARVVMPSPTRSGSSGEFVLALILAHGDDAWEMFGTGVENGMEFASANSQAISGLLSGTYDAILGAVDYLILREAERGAPIRMVFPTSGVPVAHRPAVILAGTRREIEARRFVDHCHAEAGQALAVGAGLIPADLNIREDIARPMPVRVLESDTGEALDRFARTMRRFQYDLEGKRSR